jgi:homoserine kinase type II
MIDDMFIRDVAKKWNLEEISIHPEISLQGSPERSLFRIAIKSKDKSYVLENIAPAAVIRKVNIARTLEFLFEKDLYGAYRYLLSRNGKYVEEINHTYWQLGPFIEGVSLQRPQYVYDGWRGSALAKFLLELREKSSGIPSFEPDFSIKAYIYDFVKKLIVHRPDVYEEIKPVILFLEQGFMSNHDAIPVVFCHGDYHPLNVIWAENNIRAVIDWEFCGYKPEIYDIANMIGCVGIEDPESLGAELVINFVHTLRESGSICSTSWNFLFETIVAVRFAWLAVWLNDKDEDMVQLEIDYMRLLLDRCEELKKVWGIETRIKN